jgi:hypothetical protein
MIIMAIRDRGKVKWNPASFMPEGFVMTREMFRDQKRLAKPIIDEHELEEFDSLIAYAMEYNMAVKLSVWNDGFTKAVTGNAHYLDPLTKQLRVEVKTNEFERVEFDKIVGVFLID